MGRLAVWAAMARGMPARASLAERLEGFYRPQAAAYDQTREGLLGGRRALIDRLRLELPPGGTLVELGGGTGRCLEFFGAGLTELSAVYLVDLAPALLEQARARQRARGWSRLTIVEADSAAFRPPAPVDCVYLSYTLTMAPNWPQVIDNAIAMLRPGGLLGVVDFYVAPQHSRLCRGFWPRWFRHDGVFLSAEHLPALQARLEPVHLLEAGTPLLGSWLTVPYYVFIGRRPSGP